MSDLIAIVGGRVVDAAIASALICGLIVLAMVATRQPARRRAIARAGVLASLLALPLVCARPFAPIDLIEPIRVAFGLALPRLSVTPLKGGGDWLWFATRALPVGLLIAYGLGVLAGLSRLFIGAWGAGWIARNSRPVSIESETLYQSLPFGVRRSRPRLRVSTRTSGPVLLGSFRPVILIPPALDDPESAEALRLALLHELAHAEASDPYFGLALELASIFWFWLPPLWWIRHQSRLDQEFLADRRAATQFGPSTQYAASLVAIATAPERVATSSEGKPRTGGAGSELIQRVLMLIRCPFPLEGRPPRWFRWGLAASTCGGLLLATGLTFRFAAGQSAPPQGAGSPHSISVPKIILQPEATKPSATILPIRLPLEFELSLEVYAETSQLAHIQVLGNPLGQAHPVGDSMLREEPRWHRVKVQRRRGVLLLSVDGSSSMPLPRPSVEEWFTALGIPGRNTIIRSFHLSW